jgi:hypothetical protein
VSSKQFPDWNALCAGLVGRAIARLVPPIVFLLLTGGIASAQTSVTTNRNDLARTGANLSETTLNTTNVNVAEFGKLFERTVDDEVYAQPLYVANVDVPGVGVRNVLYVATTRNTVYAFDADNPSATAPLWSRSYSSPPQVVPVHRTDVGQACGVYLDFAGNIGIIGTPVIDPATQTMYFVVRTKEQNTFRQRLHAVDLRDGSPRHAPVLITATVAGTGAGSIGGTITFNAQTQNQRPGLMLLNGIVYIGWASHCDQQPYQGWLMGYSASTLQQVMVFNVAPDGYLGGVWQSGQAMSADAAGNIYLVTGNGTVDAHEGGRSYGSSFVKLAQTGTVVDWFTPHNYDFLNSIDADLITGAVLIPDTNLVIGAGKQGVVYVLDRSNMGHHRSGSDNQIVQSFQGSTAGRMNGSPVYWNTPTNGQVIYLWPGGDPLKAFRLTNGRFQTTPIGQSAQSSPESMPGGIMSLSAFNSSPGTGILWATISDAGDANNATQPGILRAYDANNVTRELWNSRQNAARDDLGNFAKFNPPTIVNGKVYVPTFSNKVVVYGLLGGGPGNSPPAVNAGADQTITLPSTATLTGAATDDGNPNPPGALSPTWTKVTGPGTVTFNPATALTTTASFAMAGTYSLRLSVCDGSACASDVVTVVANPAPTTGTGLRAQFFNDAGDGTYFTTSVLSRVDPVVDFTWPASPGTGVQADNFSVQWLGQVQPTTSGDYIFSTESDEGVRLWLNNALIIDHWTSHSTATDNSVPIPLVANVPYDIRLEFFDAAGPAAIRLRWTPPGGPSQPIPQAHLYPAPPPNQPPTVNAGADQTITLPNTAQLTGTVSDDGLPSPGTLTYTWSKISGREESENVVVFSDPHSLITTVTFPASDVYVLRLTVSDGALTSSDDVTVTVNPAPNGTGLLGQYYNDPTPANHFTTLILSRIDPVINFDWGFSPPGAAMQNDIFTVRWTGKVQAVVSGAHVFTTAADDGVRLWINGQLVIDNWEDQAETTRDSAPITLVAGQFYDVRMEFYDNTEDAVARLFWSYPGQTRMVIPQSQLHPPGTNQPPTVNAGADRTITMPGTTLTGLASDDGLPPPGVLTTTWSRVSGPGTVTFGNANGLSTTASFSTSGTYVLRLTASDSALTRTDDVTITVNPAPPVNQPPTVNAGADQTITLPAAASVAGTASDDGAPNPPAALTTTWSLVTGSGTVTFGNANALSTTASFSTNGTYVLRLTASDSALTRTDDVTITVNPASPMNQPPTVNAGTDQTITLPAGAGLSGTATDDGLPNPPAVLSTTWSRVSGPGTVTFGNANALSTTASFSTNGTYVLRLTASDSALTRTDDVTITVNASAGGTGLTGAYYNGNNFGTLRLTRVDPVVDFDWGRTSPATGVNQDNFSVRWTGQVVVPVTGNYTFTTVSDDGVRVWVNAQQIINNWANNARLTANSAPIALVGGTSYSIVIEYYEKTNAASMRLQWSYPGQATVRIPQSQLFQQ